MIRVIRRPVRLFALAFALACAVAAAACTAEGEGDRRLVVFNAGSLARPIRAALDTFAVRHDVLIEQESAGSLESARKITELGKIPDLIALADVEIFPRLLVPEHADWYATFARNRMVVAHTDRSRHASEVNTENWWRVLQRPDVEVGRADPDLDPNGYRTLLVMQLAEQHYGDTTIMEGLLARSPQRNVRPKEADLVGLLQAGELDYIWSYESMAQAAELPYVTFPAEIDLSDPQFAERYARASVRVLGRQPGDTIEFVGEPIVYGLSIPRGAPHPELAREFVAWLLSDDGRRVLRAARLDALDAPAFTGDAPEALVNAVR